MNRHQKEYNRLRKNLLRQVKSMQERGFIFLAGDPVPEIPKRITEASVNRLEKIRKNIYEKARWVDPETGKETSGVRGQEIQKERAGKKGWRKRREREEPLVPPAIDIPTYSMYDRIREDLASRKTYVYTRTPGSRKSIKYSFSPDIRRCLQTLDNAHNADPEGYESYLTENETDILEMLLASEVTADFMSDISEILEAYSDLAQILNYQQGPPREPKTEDEEGFLNIEDLEDIPFY